MKCIYFVRHAESDYSVHDDLTRPLTAKGLEDSKKITKYLTDKNITKVYSSPYKRSVDTIKDFVEQKQLDINIIDDFRERKISDEWIDDFNEFSKNQWNDFDFKLLKGESLNEVQKRNINALLEILESCEDDNIAIGTHGTALSTIINYFNNDFGYEHFERIRPLMPHIICLSFNGVELVDFEEIALYEIEK